MHRVLMLGAKAFLKEAGEGPVIFCRRWVELLFRFQLAALL